MATYYVRKTAAFSVAASPSGYYYFDGSDAAASDPDAVWTDETNADDGSTSTVAYTTSTGNETTNELKLEGTNAPASGPTINNVSVRIYLGPTNDTSSCVYRVYTDGEADDLGQYNLNELLVPGWNGNPSNDPQPLSTPSGGWTWAKVQGLEIKLWFISGNRLEIAKVDVIVNIGESADSPYGTIDEAANAVAAGDTVYVGAGVYREQVTMDTAGTSGNLISYIADVDGSQTSDPGLVIISAYDDETSAATRTKCWDVNKKEFITVTGFTMTGGTSGVVWDSTAGNTSYEELTFEDCAFIAGHDDFDLAFRIDMNATTSVPTTAGLTLRRNVFVGACLIQYDENATSETNIKATIDSNLFVGLGDTTTSGPNLDFSFASASTWPVGGISVTNNTFFGGGYAIYVQKPTATTFTNPITVRNNTYLFADRDISMSASGSEDFIDSDYNTSSHVSTTHTNVTQGPNDRVNSTDPGLYGGIADIPLIRATGFSPWRFMESITLDDGVDAYTNAVIGAGDTTAAPSFDLYNEARPMGSRLGERTDIYYFDASDAGPTDEGTVWTNDSNAFNGSDANGATTSTVGTTSTNRLLGQGTNAPTTGLGVSTVQYRTWASSSDGTGDWRLRIYTDGEGEMLVNALDSDLPSGGRSSGWQSVTEPSGGWTWAKVAALEAWFYLTSGTDITVYNIELRVTSTPVGQDDQGAVEARTRPTQETTTTRTGTNAIQLGGAGYHDFLVPVKNQSTTVSIYGRYDSNYTGSLPILEVLNIDGVADQSDVMVAAANTWEELTATFTPTADGVCRVRVRSQDTSSDGEAFFDDLTVT
jgi:hypothetical protein